MRLPGLEDAWTCEKSSAAAQGEVWQDMETAGGDSVPLPYYEAAYFDVGGAGGREARENPEGTRGLRLPEKDFL